MAPFKSTGGSSVGKLLSVFRNRDLTLNSGVKTNRIIVPPDVIISTTNVDSINTSGNYKYATWITPGSFSVSLPGTVSYLLIGGGGEGAGQNSIGNDGSPSTALGLTAYGGGAGAGYNANTGRNGGSGGGGGGNGGTGGLGSYVTGTAPTSPVPNQGNNGGDAPAVYGGAGGGGAGAAGAPAPTNTAWRVGGIGKVAFSGDSSFPSSYGTAGPTPGRWFAAGGGGAGGNPAGAAPAQPVGGGGAGSNSSGSLVPAIANTGSGGGGLAPPSAGGSAGGGAGGFLEGSMALSVGPYSITIGTGGNGASPGGGDGADGIFVLRVPSPSIIT